MSKYLSTIIIISTQKCILEAKSASCGQLIPNTEGVIKDLTTGQNLGPHESGELWVRGPQVILIHLF